MKKILIIALGMLMGTTSSLLSETTNNEIIEYNGKKVTKPYVRFKHFDEMRSFPFTELTADKRIRAIQSAESMFHSSNKKALTQAQQPEWRPIGPFNVGGRVKSVAIHPEIEGVVYIGAAAGGIWKTTDSGQNWEPIFDYENGIGFGSLCIDVNNPDIIYAATGEAVLNSAAPMYISAGVYKTTDAGDTWFPIGLTNAGAFSKFYVHPLNPNKLVGGVVSVNHGFYYSTDAGISWNKSENFAKDVSDITFNPNDENEYFSGVIGEGVYYTSNSGASWEKRSNGLPESLGRVSVQLAPSDPDVLYSLLEDEGQGGNGLIYKSTDRGMSWMRSYKGNSSFFNGQGWYNNYIMVHPENPNIVFAGGIHLWRTTNGGESTSNWRNMTAGIPVHVDHHCGAFNPLNLNEIYIGNDGGVYRSKNLGDDFTNLNNGLELTQFYSMDLDQGVLNRTFGGTQDNGTLGNHQNTESWSWVNGDDGFQTVVDYEDPNTIYGEVNSLGSVYPFRRNLSTGDFKLLNFGISSSDNTGIWDAPLVIHPIHSFALYHGRNSLYYSFSNGNSWDVGIPNNPNKFTAIAVSPINDMMIYAGDITGGLFVTKDHFEEYHNVSSNGLVARTITDIECSSLNEETAFVTASGFGTDHIFKTTNAGDSWISISEKFPDIPCNSIIMHPENEDWLFAGTDIGVFATFNGGNSWLPFGRKLPKTIITGMRILNNSFTGNYILRVSTFGRSMWEVDIPNDIVNEPEITSPTGGEVLTGTADYIMSWYGFEKPVRFEISYDDGETWYVKAEDLNSSYIKMKMPNKNTYLNRIRVSSKVNPEQVKISNTFSIMPVQRGSILKTSSFSFVPYGIAWDGGEHLYSTSFYGNNLYKINKKTLLVEDSKTVPGDSLFTDLTIDREEEIIYIHRMNSSGETGTGGVVVITDMEGNEINSYDTPAKYYPIGIEIVDNDLIICDRDGSPQYIYITQPSDGRVWEKLENPFVKRLGPRGLCYDGERYLYQASTDFSGSGGPIGTYIIKIDKNDLSKEVERIPLVSRSGNINCRGIEYDPNDKNFWITDFGGNIYKIAGFETILEVEEENTGKPNPVFEAEIYPNPMYDFSTITFSSGVENAVVDIHIFDVMGRIVNKFHKTLAGGQMSSYLQIDSKDFSTGIYYVTFSLNGERVLNKELVIIK